MPHAPESWTSSELDLQRIEYFRAVADYADMVSRGGDLTAVCQSARYVQCPALALMVPTLSSSVGTLSSADLADLPQRLADDPRPVRSVLGQLMARNCLVRDVLRCLAQYYDRDVAKFWAARVAA